MNNPPVYIVGGLRSPQLKAVGQPGPFTASDMATQVCRQLLLRQNFAASDLDHVLFGCVSSTPDEANIARVIALRSGCAIRTPAMTVQRNCASGLQAIDCGASLIRSNRAELVLVGGTEAMSHHPLLFSEALVRWLAKWNRARSLGSKTRTLAQLPLRHLQPVVALLRGLRDPVVGWSMGQTAEQLAEDFDISRADMDAYALHSHKRLAQAVESGYLQEIVPLYDHKGRVYDHDNGLRSDGSLEKLARLRPAFDPPFGKVTAGNSAQISDGACALLLASEKAVERHQLQAKGRILDIQWAGLAPERMGLGPVYAMAKVLKRQHLDSPDIDYWEINEAFAAQVLACLAAWRDNEFCRNELALDNAFRPIPEDRLNVDGGGISLGHPVGASGARIVLHLLEVLERKQARRGVASLCIGGGQGGALLLQREAS